MQEPAQHTSRNHERLSQEWLQSRFEGRGDRLDVFVFDTLDSTNRWCLQELRRNRAVPFVCLAEQQTQGRGRHGRSWLSVAGGSLLMSVVVRVPLPSGDAGALSPAIGLALFDAVRSLGASGVQLKWPNDILVDGGKLAGILVETICRANEMYAVIGVGMNLDLGNDEPAIDQPWTDLRRCPGVERVERNALASLLIDACLDMVERLEVEPQRVMDAYSAAMHSYASRVRVLQHDGIVVEGKVLGVSRRGQLRLQVKGEELLVSNAELERTQIRIRASGHAA